MALIPVDDLLLQVRAAALGAPEKIMLAKLIICVEFGAKSLNAHDRGMIASLLAMSAYELSSIDPVPGEMCRALH
jgi:hypothetical protein